MYRHLYYTTMLTVAALTAPAMLFGQSAQAALILTSLLPAENVVGGVNEGGLNSGVSYTNGDDALDFQIEFVEDGVTFDSVLTMSFSAGSFTTTNASGTTTLRLANGTNGTVTFTMGAVNSSSPGTHTASFDGFSALAFRNGGDGNFGGNIYTFAGGSPPPLTSVSLEPSGTVLADAPGGGLMDFTGIESSFTVSETAIPEPSSFALLSLMGVGTVARRRLRGWRLRQSSRLL